MTDVSLVALRSGTQKATPAVRVFLKDRASEDAFRQCFATLGVEGVQFTAGTVDTAVPVLIKEKSPQLLVVDVSGIEDPVASLCELADVCDPDVSVVVIGEHNDVVLYRDMKNAGVAEYFLKPLVWDQLTHTCKRVLFPEIAGPFQRTGKLVFMLGVRGGAGATTIAINTAWHLSEARRRRTLLLDLDLHGGDIPLQLDTKPADALREALDHPERVDKLFLERGTKPITKRLDLLACLKPLQSSPGFAEEAARLLLEKLLPHYRFVIVDLPHYAAAWTKTMLRLPSTCIVISNASLAAARDTGRWSEDPGRQYLRPQHDVCVEQVVCTWRPGCRGVRQGVGQAAGLRHSLRQRTRRGFPGRDRSHAALLLLQKLPPADPQPAGGRGCGEEGLHIPAGIGLPVSPGISAAEMMVNSVRQS